jgi:hypothetical protein
VQGTESIMFRSHRRLFKTSKLFGMTYRLTRNVWWDFFRQLKMIWKKPVVVKITRYSENTTYANMIEAKRQAQGQLEELDMQYANTSQKRIQWN